MKYKLDEKYEPFGSLDELFDNDKYILSLLVFLQVYKDNENQIRLTEITKKIDWKNEDFHDSIDGEDFYSSQDQSFTQAETFYEYSKLGFFTSVGIEDYEETINKILLHFK